MQDRFVLECTRPFLAEQPSNSGFCAIRGTSQDHGTLVYEVARCVALHLCAFELRLLSTPPSDLYAGGSILCRVS